MLDRLTIESLSELTAPHSPPCLSLYMPTHRHAPDNKQDLIRYRNSIRELETSLQSRFPATEIESLLERFEEIAQDRKFWNHTLDGLVVLGAADIFRVYRLQQTVPELAIVADSFHIKPLRRFLQSVDRYQVLGLSRSRFQLFEGNRNRLDEIEPAEGIPKTLTEALGDEVTEPRLTVGAYGGAGGSQAAMHHGHGGKKDEADIDAERFFRIVDRAVHKHHSSVTGLPLILAALPEHHHLFHKLSHNPFLVEQGLTANTEGLPIEQIRQRIWEIVEPQIQLREVAMVEAFSTAKAHGLGSSEIKEVAEAAANGRVSSLMIESGRQIAGRLDNTTGQILHADLSDPEVDDLLDDLGALVEMMGGDVMVMPPERMPGQTGLAATFRH